MTGTVEIVARSMARAMGQDPDQGVPETGYRNAPIIPAWRHEIEWARRFLAGVAALDEIKIDSWRYDV